MAAMAGCKHRTTSFVRLAIQILTSNSKYAFFDIPTKFSIKVLGIFTHKNENNENFSGKCKIMTFSCGRLEHMRAVGGKLIPLFQWPN